MRIPHHLIRNPSGTYAFRQRVLSDLQVVIGRKLIKQTLRTANLASARLRAIVLASGYAHAYDVLRDRRVDRFSKKDLGALVERLSGGADRRDLTLHRTQAADGTITERWQIDSEDDVRLFRQAHNFVTASEVAVIGIPGHLLSRPVKEFESAMLAHQRTDVARPWSASDDAVVLNDDPVLAAWQKANGAPSHRLS